MIYQNLFTADEVRRAKDIVAKTDLGEVQRKMATIVTSEVMARIDKQTGQTNDRAFMCYALEYLVSLEKRGLSL